MAETVEYGFEGSDGDRLQINVPASVLEDPKHPRGSLEAIYDPAQDFIELQPLSHGCKLLINAAALGVAARRDSSVYEKFNRVIWAVSDPRTMCTPVPKLTLDGFGGWDVEMGIFGEITLPKTATDQVIGEVAESRMKRVLKQLYPDKPYMAAAVQVMVDRDQIGIDMRTGLDSTVFTAAADRVPGDNRVEFGSNNVSTSEGIVYFAGLVAMVNAHRLAAQPVSPE